jgi:hypothetical protein
VWFKKWILGKSSIPVISKESGYSARTLKSYFKQYLCEAPTWTMNSSERVNLIIDGTYFNNNLCLIIYRDQQIKFTQLYRLTDGEWYEEIKEDLLNLKSLGINIESITCDGHRAILKAVKQVCKDTILQRCTVHLQRMCKVWLSSNPKSEQGSQLLKIANKIGSIRSVESSHYWLASLAKWYEMHKDFVDEKSMNLQTCRTWYTHKNVRRSFVVLKRAIPNMFCYLQNPRIPKSTNPLEAFFGHLKSNLSVHRGLSRENKKNFIKWYLYFRNYM